MPELVRELLYLFDRRGRFLLAGLLALSFLGACAELVGIGAVLPLVSLLSEPDAIASHALLSWLYRAVGQPGSQTFALGLCGGLAVIFILKNLFIAGTQYLLVRFTFEYLWKRTGRRLFQAYLHADYVFHLQNNSARLLRNLTTELDGTAQTVLIPAITIITEVFVIVLLTLLLVAIEPVATCLALLWLLAAVGVAYLALRRSMARIGVRRQQFQALTIRNVNQGLGGIKAVKVAGREAFFLDAYARGCQPLARAKLWESLAARLPRLYIETVVVVTFVVAIIIVLLQGGDFVASLPSLSLFAMVAFRLLPSLTRLLSAFNSLRLRSASLEAIYREFVALETGALLQGPAIAEPTAGSLLLRDRLVFQDVTYRYPGSDADTLHEIALEIPRGARIGFVGTSGAGKTTLVDVLLGLLVPQSGCVLADGRDIHANVRAWQRTVGYVPQEVYLCDGSLQDNIAFGEPVVDTDRLARAVHLAQLDALVFSLPAGLHTTVGERGVRLSGGQKQRIGIARALYRDPSVLVLDEATAALDNETESEFMRSLTALGGERTMAIVAHRLSTVRDCDCIYVLDAGRIADAGTYADLCRDSRKFKQLAGLETSD